MGKLVMLLAMNGRDAEQFATYDLEWEVYELEDERYERKIAALGTIWTAIFQTVAREHLARVLEKSENLSEVEREPGTLVGRTEDVY